MTDREVYAMVYAANIGGYMACSQRVTLRIEGSDSPTIAQYAHAAAMHAVEHAPKENGD